MAKKSARRKNFYSFRKSRKFINNNFALVFMLLIIFILGFLTGSLWTGNKIINSNNHNKQQKQVAGVKNKN
ncbi:MAG: hypothetical protein PVJ09_04870 [Candidatus Woesebacteria bacterium]|jgi:hypothetical protein